MPASYREEGDCCVPGRWVGELDLERFVSCQGRKQQLFLPLLLSVPWSFSLGYPCTGIEVESLRILTSIGKMKGQVENLSSVWHCNYMETREQPAQWNLRFNVVLDLVKTTSCSGHIFCNFWNSFCFSFPLFCLQSSKWVCFDLVLPLHTANEAEECLLPIR